jgi:hypothetical protein
VYFAPSVLTRHLHEVQAAWWHPVPLAGVLVSHDAAGDALATVLAGDRVADVWDGHVNGLL